MSEFALTMDYAGQEVSEVQYMHDRAKYYNEVPSREEFLRFCESLLENEERCEHVAEKIEEEARTQEAERVEGELTADIEDTKSEADRLQAKLDGLDTLLNQLEGYFEAIKPRNDKELTLLKRIQIELYGESYA